MIKQATKTNFQLVRYKSSCVRYPSWVNLYSVGEYLQFVPKSILFYEKVKDDLFYNSQNELLLWFVELDDDVCPYNGRKARFYIPRIKKAIMKRSINE